MKLEGQSIVGVHHASRCEGEHCTIHDLSHHPLRNDPQFFDNGTLAMYRVCQHRQFHIDPDEMERNLIAFACDRCCGCCKRVR